MPNALSREKSPYLLQHADNPVEWLPWGEAAFARARDAQKPVFLSIGYSTCHWCHVMAHESFESEAVAGILNEHFIPIKVDREERPDVDRVYMAYVQAMTGHGGWPLNVWLSPDLKPFYGGTYFPPDDRQGRPGFPAVLMAIARGWREQRGQFVAEGDRAVTLLREHFSAARRIQDGVPLKVAAAAAWQQGFAHFRETFDRVHGGFGGAPKFPRASNLTFLLRFAALKGPGSEIGAGAIAMAAATLRSMAAGGIHDHVGGGFHRYSVDEAWFVPHFEKMLTDQAQIALNCLEAKQATGDERFGWLARDILEYVQRDLTAPEGGFYTAEDADSMPQGVAAGSGSAESAGAHGKRKSEGAFYLWSVEELRELLGGNFAFFATHFGVDEAGNVPARLDSHGEFRGRNVLVQRRSLMDSAGLRGLTPEQANERLIDVLDRLRAVRQRRPRPERDDKVVTAGNGLMISALARARQVLGPAIPGDHRGEDYLARAIRGAEFIQRELHDSARGVLYRTWRNGRGATEGFAEDYAFLIQGLIDLYEACFDIRWLQWAERLQTAMDERFRDDARGGYFNSAAGDPGIILRLQETYDGAEPAPGSVAALNLLRLAAMTGEPSARERGVRTLESFREHWSKAPQAMPQMLCALEFILAPPRHVVIAGDPGASDFQSLTTVLHERLGPRRVLLAADGGEGQAWLARRAPWIAQMRPIDGRATAYVCEDCACQAPTTEPGELRRLLGAS